MQQRATYNAERPRRGCKEEAMQGRGCWWGGGRGVCAERALDRVECREIMQKGLAPQLNNIVGLS